MDLLETWSSYRTRWWAGSYSDLSSVVCQVPNYIIVYLYTSYVCCRSMLRGTKSVFAVKRWIQRAALNGCKGYSRPSKAALWGCWVDGKANRWVDAASISATSKRWCLCVCSTVLNKNEKYPEWRYNIGTVKSCTALFWMNVRLFHGFAQWIPMSSQPWLSLMAELISPTIEYDLALHEGMRRQHRKQQAGTYCGKFPQSSAELQSRSSESRPTWFRQWSKFSKRRRASSFWPILANAFTYQNVQIVKAFSEN